MEELERAQELFFEKFNGKPEVVSFAPSRVNVIGEHTDYNEGFVMPAALNRVTAFAGRRRDDDKAVVYSHTLKRTVYWDVKVLEKTGDFSDYLKGVIKHLPHPPGGFEAVIYSSVPVGAGVSSSAALEVSFTNFLNELFSLNLSKEAVVKIAHQAEYNFVGVRCGIMDQYIAVHARKDHLLLIDTRKQNHLYVPFPEKWMLAVVDSRVKRELNASEYNRRRHECEEVVKIISRYKPDIKSLRDLDEQTLFRFKSELSPTHFKRAMHVISENKRVLEIAEYMKKRDRCMIEKTMALAHKSLAEDFEVSIPEIDFLVEAASSLPWVYGARLTGAGFGGSIVVLLEAGHESQLEEFLRKKYMEKFDREPGFIFSRPFQAGAAYRL